MTDLAVIRGTFSDWRPVKSRSVLQLVIELPIEQTQDVLDRLGVPIPGVEKWVAVALLKDSVEAVEPVEPQKPAPVVELKPARKWHDMKPSQQAGMLCADPLFLQFIRHRTNNSTIDDTAEWVRGQCAVRSRAELDEDPFAKNEWLCITADFFRWKNEPAE